MTSDNIAKLAAALVAVQQEVRGAKKDSENPHFKSKYADLAAVWDACRDALHKYKVAVIQMPGYENGIVTMTTRLLHESGEWIESTAGAPIEARTANAQGVGSAVTYLRRYALAAMVGVVTEDDDGNAASRPAPKREDRKADQHGEIILPGTDQHWEGDGGKPLSRASELALRKCRDWYLAKGKRQDLIDAINDEFEQRRSASLVSGAPTGADASTREVRDGSATPVQMGGKSASPTPVTSDKDSRRDDPPLPHAISQADEVDALILSIDRELRSAKALKVGAGGIAEGKLALIEARYHALGEDAGPAAYEAILGTIEKAKAGRAPA
jgi:hypothetical protein